MWNEPRELIRCFALAVLLVSVASNHARAQCNANATYPGATWPDATAATAVSNQQQIAALERYMFVLTGPDSARQGIRTDGMVIIQNGSIIYEKYARSFTAQNPHEAWSITKSVESALMGIATQHGVSLSDSVCKYFPKVRSQTCAVTLQMLLEQSSGLQWDELYENQSNQYSSVLSMLYGQGHSDMPTFVAGHDLKFPAGSTWYYSTGGATLLASALDTAMKPALGDDWAWDTLFTPIGMTSAVLERDNSGNSVGGSYLYATPEDLARFGYLYLNQGCWNGQQLLPANWVTSSVQVVPALVNGKADSRDPGDVYGWLWWLNQTAPAVGQTTLPFPGVPPDAFAAEGHWGQWIIVIPSRNMVIVRTGDDRDSTALNSNTFITLAMAVGH